MLSKVHRDPEQTTQAQAWGDGLVYIDKHVIDPSAHFVPLYARITWNLAWRCSTWGPRRKEFADKTFSHYSLSQSTHQFRGFLSIARHSIVTEYAVCKTGSRQPCCRCFYPQTREMTGKFLPNVSGHTLIWLTNQKTGDPLERHGGLLSILRTDLKSVW